MQGKSVDISYLDEFVYLADSLSYGKTAEHFYVNRSVISRHMSALEASVGVRLLNRDSRGVALTEAGRVFYQDSKVVLRDWERALESVGAIGKSEGPLVRIGYLRNSARPVIVRFARHMAEVYPELHLSLACMEYNDLQRALADRAVDVAISLNVKPSISRSYRSTALYEDRFYPVCAKSHPFSQRRGMVRFNDLRDQKLLLPDGYLYTGLAPLMDGLAGEKGVRLAQSLYQDMDTLYLKVETEGYVAFASGVYNAMFDNRLVILPIKDAVVPFGVSAFYHDDFSGSIFRACCEGFEWCRDNLAIDVPDLNFSLVG